MPTIQRELQAHMRRLMTSEQMARFVHGLPGMRIESELPDSMSSLLREIDTVSRKRKSASAQVAGPESRLRRS